MGKTEEVLNILRKELLNGQYKPGSKFPSEHQLMMRFKAARTTVNKIALQLVAEGLIERKQKGAGTYVKETIPFPVGYLAYLGNTLSPYYVRVLDGIELAAFQKNYAVCVLPNHKEVTYHCLEKIRNSRFRGLLVSNLGILPEPLPIPVVYVDNGYEVRPPVSASVTCTNYKGAADMAETVIGRGHREIVICTNYIDLEAGRPDRIRGFTDTLAKYGIGDIRHRIFHEPIQDRASARFVLKRILKLFPETTVIMTDSDMVAFRLMQAMSEQKMPHRITITGFGNIGFEGGLLKFPSVEQHPEEIGIQSVNELLRMIEDPDYVSSGRIEIETELVNLDKLPQVNR